MRPNGPPAQRDQSIAASLKIFQTQTRIAFAAAHLRARDELAEICVAALVFDQQHDPRTVFKGELAADDCLDAAPARMRREPHHAIEAVAIGERNCRQSQFGRALDQLFGMRPTLQKAEVGPRMELGIGVQGIAPGREVTLVIV